MWKKINLGMALPDFEKEDKMTDLENLFQLNADNASANRVAKYAFEVKKVFDADSCAHLIQHLEAKMKDPEEKGCTDPVNFVMFVLFEALNPDEMLLFIEAIRPEQHELGQDFGGVIKAIMDAIARERKKGNN